MSQPILEASTIREIMVGGDTPPMSDQYLANTTQRIVTLMFIDVSIQPCCIRANSIFNPKMLFQSNTI